ncbi:MAG: acyl-CoA desaturase [Myxococcales bacterium]|nr:acyl-CoA desaturase [Myxococcales bacterium]
MQAVPELGALRQELKLAGMFRHHEVRSWFKLAFLLGVVASCLVGIAMYGWFAALFLVPVASVFATSAAMLGHEGSHRSFSSSPTRNAFVTYLAFPLFSGLSALYWREKHDRLHHGHPNVEGLDPDIRPWPFVSTKGDHEQQPRHLRWFQRKCQAWAFWPMTTLMTAGMRRSSLIHLFNYPKKHGRDRAWWIEVACQTTHYTAWLVVPSLIWGPLAAFLVYSALWAGVGVLLVLVFAPAHMGLPVVKEQNNDWVHQLETTRNLQLPRFISFFFIGLDYQVEHHIFPKIPHHNLPRAAQITSEWCKRHGVPHMSVPYLHALGDAARYMARGYEREALDPLEVRAGLVGSSSQLAA